MTKELEIGRVLVELVVAVAKAVIGVHTGDLDEEAAAAHLVELHAAALGRLDAMAKGDAQADAAGDAALAARFAPEDGEGGG